MTIEDGGNMKIYDRIGKIEIWDQEGGFCSPMLKIDGDSFVDTLEYILHKDGLLDGDGARGIYRIFVERIKE